MFKIIMLWVNIMNEIDKSKMKKVSDKENRLSRRRLLKTGAVMAPLALTLHGGIPLAHADSAGLCVLHLEELAQEGDPTLQLPLGPQGQLVPFDGGIESHWEYITADSSRHGYSCLNSIDMFHHINNL